jgi:hypothetical protein
MHGSYVSRSDSAYQFDEEPVKMVVFVVIIQDLREEQLAWNMTPVICCGT